MVTTLKFGGFLVRHLAPTQWAVGDCPPLKEIPDEGARRYVNFFFDFIKINDFLYEICSFHRFYLRIFDRNFWDFMKNLKNLKNLKKFSKILKKKFEISFRSKIFSKFFFHKKNRKKSEKKFLKTYMCYTPSRSEFNSERGELYKY